MKLVSDGNNEIIQTWTAQFVLDLREAEARYNIKHSRNKPPVLHKAKFKVVGGEIVCIGINLTKGIIMTNKGVGKYPDNRIAKPAFNEVAEKDVPELADRIANATGDFIAGHIFID